MSYLVYLKTLLSLKDVIASVANSSIKILRFFLVVIIKTDYKLMKLKIVLGIQKL